MSLGTRRNARVRCAIYTRKSSEEGLEQEVNSLQAQREACRPSLAANGKKAGGAYVRLMTTVGSPARRWVGRLYNGCWPTSRRGGSTP